MAGSIFVTGAGSFIGAAVIAAARRAGAKVDGVDLAPPAGDGFLRGDINDPDLADLIPQGTRSLVHLAALSRDPDCRGKGVDCYLTNVVGALNVAAAAARRGVRQLVFASTEWVYDRPDGERACDEDTAIDPRRLASEYALSKFTAELALRRQLQDTSCRLTVLRFGIVYGPRPTNWGAVESLLHQVATQDRVTVGARATARRYIHVDDVAAAVRMACDRAGGEIINVQGPRLVCLGEVVDLSARLLGRAPQVIETDPANPSIRDIAADKAERLLDWRPEIEISDGLARLADYFGYLDRPGARRGAA